MSVPSPEEVITTYLCDERAAEEIVDELESAGYRIVRKPDNRPKLTDRDVRLIREMHRNGHSVTELATTFDVHHSTISRTLKGVYH